MGVRLRDGNVLTVRASRPYLYLSCIFLAYAALVFLLLFLPEEFAGDPVSDRLMLVGLAALPSVYFALIYKNKRVCVDGTGITVRTLFGFERSYSWKGLAGSEKRSNSLRGAIYRACVIRPNGKRVVEVPSAFDSYHELLSLLKRRGCLEMKR